MATSEDDAPKRFKYLTEVAAPAPEKPKKARLWLGYSADSLRSKSRKVKVEGTQDQVTSNAEDGKDSYAQPGNYETLDVVAAPSPVDRESQKGEPHLEDRSEGSSPSKERVHGGTGLAPPYRASRLATELYNVSYLVFFSIFGTLARLGLQALTLYPGAPVQTGLLWANVGGSMILGFLTQDQKLFREEHGSNAKQEASDEEKGHMPNGRSWAANQRSALNKTIPLYIGLATGFCGSFTSFSSFMRDAFYALANALPVPISHPSATDPPSPISTTLNVPRNPGYSFLALLAVLITTLGLSMGALQVGAHLALALDPYTPPFSFRFIRKYVDHSFVVLGWGCWLAAILLAIFPPDRPGGPVGDGSWSQETWRSQALFALVFAPLGCLLRFYASFHLNGRINSFPLGTFVVNVSGSVMEAVFIDLQHAPIGGMVGCQVLQGMSDGFCGCLTTVSTWVVEIKGLRRRHAYVYGGASIAFGLSSFIIATGSLMWSQGFSTALCVT